MTKEEERMTREEEAALLELLQNAYDIIEGLEGLEALEYRDWLDRARELLDNGEPRP